MTNTRNTRLAVQADLLKIETIVALETFARADRRGEDAVQLLVSAVKPTTPGAQAKLQRLAARIDAASDARRTAFLRYAREAETLVKDIAALLASLAGDTAKSLLRI